MAEAGIFDANDSVELLDGHVVEMPAENKPHRVAIAKATDVFVRALAERPYFLQSHSTLPLDELNVPEPDLPVLRGAPDDVLEEEPESFSSLRWPTRRLSEIDRPSRPSTRSRDLRSTGL